LKLRCGHGYWQTSFLPKLVANFETKPSCKNLFVHAFGSVKYKFTIEQYVTVQERTRQSPKSTFTTAPQTQQRNMHL
jgi:hypothetical protein